MTGVLYEWWILERYHRI